MKRIITGLALLSASSVTMAEAPGGPDCGWGNLLFEGQSGLGPYCIASITNGTSGNNTFGMTSGTNGCSTDGTLTYGGKSLIGSIISEFTEDVARGEGDALDASGEQFSDGIYRLRAGYIQNFVISTNHSIRLSAKYEWQEVDEFSDIQLSYQCYF